MILDGSIRSSGDHTKRNKVRLSALRRKFYRLSRLEILLSGHLCALVGTDEANSTPI
jgi:hypothetical protein